MKKCIIYVVRYDDSWNEAHDVLKAFCSEEAAEAYIERCVGNWIESKQDEVRDYYSIDEINLVLDEEGS